MKHSTPKILLIAGLGLWLGAALPTGAQEKVTETPTEQKGVQNARYEYGMIKWDKPDNIQIITPKGNQQVRVYKAVKLPHGISDEEFCITWAINNMAASGWEPVSLDGPRVLLRRDLD